MMTDQLILYLVLIVLGLVASMRPVPVVRAVIRVYPAVMPQTPSVPVRLVRYTRIKAAQATTGVAIAAQSVRTGLAHRITVTKKATATMARTCEEALMGAESGQSTLTSWS